MVRLTQCCRVRLAYIDLFLLTLDLLNFPLPHGVRLILSSLATPQFSTSYQLGAFGHVDGSIAYLYSSVPLNGVIAQSDRIPLVPLLQSYRQLKDLGLGKEERSFGAPGRTSVLRDDETRHHPHRRRVYGPTLFYGSMFLPHSTLHARVIKRITSHLQAQVSAVSSEELRNGGTILGSAHYDQGIYNVEALASTDGGLLGVRGLYNFGGDASPGHVPPLEQTGNGERERIYGRFSVGGELYYGTLNKSAGMSVGARFATLPAYMGTPLTATLTINPLMGNISATYAVLAREKCSLATMMDFNVYSYESDWKIGMELWSKRRPGRPLLGADSGDSTETAPAEGEDQTPKRRPRSFQAKMEWRLDDPEPTDKTAGVENTGEEGEQLGVLKARLDQHGRIGLLWEGRIKSLLFSLGAGIDLRRLDQSFQSVGLNIQYSS